MSNPKITGYTRQPNPLPPNLSAQPAHPATPNPAAPADFSKVLAGAQKISGASVSRPGVSRWQGLGFLATQALPRKMWPWVQTGFSKTIDHALAARLNAPTVSVNPTDPSVALQPMTLADYPRPPADNGKGIHWIPTVKQSPEVVNKFVEEAKLMGMKWVVFLNDGANIEDNNYLVDQLSNAGIEPVMRIYTPGLSPASGDVTEMVRHYTKKGVRYFQLFNEPNLMVETGGQTPNVDRYLDLWIPAAKQVIQGGGLPGIGALSPQGEMDDREFLRQMLVSLINRGEGNLLNKSWLAMHNYTGPRPLNDPDGFMRFKQYNNIVQQTLGHPLPIIGTEGGTHITEQVSEAQQVNMVTGAYNYMQHREPYNFAYTYWIIANGHDSAWDQHALFTPNGPTKLAQELKNLAAGGTQ